MHFCKAPLWGRCLGKGYLNPTPRIAHCGGIGQYGRNGVPQGRASVGVADVELLRAAVVVVVVPLLL